jgi:hypothetical protein
MSKIVGHNSRLLVAINAATAGVTFGGAAGTADCIRIKSGGFKYEDRLPKTPLEEATVFKRDHVKGGKIITWTMDVEWSYSYREKLDQLIQGGAIVTTGAAVPYTHTEEIVTKLLNGNLKVQYTDQAAQPNEVFQDEFPNAVVTAFSHNVEVGTTLSGTLSGIASSREHLENVASLATVMETEKISWLHNAPTLDGVSTYILGSFNLDLNAALDEAPFGMAASSPAIPFGNFRKGGFTLDWGVKLFADTAILAQINVDSDWTSPNQMLFNNGGLNIEEREYSITPGDSYVVNAPRVLGNAGMEPVDVKLHAEHHSGTPLIVTHYKNARVTIPA